MVDIKYVYYNCYEEVTTKYMDGFNFDLVFELLHFFILITGTLNPFSNSVFFLLFLIPSVITKDSQQLWQYI